MLVAAPNRDIGEIIDATMRALSADGDGFSISASFGTAFIPSEAADVVAALTIADQRLYAQKRALRRALASATLREAHPQRC